MRSAILILIVAGSSRMSIACLNSLSLTVIEVVKALVSFCKVCQCILGYIYIRSALNKRDLVSRCVEATPQGHDGNCAVLSRSVLAPLFRRLHESWSAQGSRAPGIFDKTGGGWEAF